MILTISRRPSATYENQALQVNKNYYFNDYWIDHWQLIHGKDSCSRAFFSQDNQIKDRTATFISFYNYIHNVFINTKF